MFLLKLLWYRFSDDDVRSKVMSISLAKLWPLGTVDMNIRMVRFYIRYFGYMCKIYPHGYIPDGYIPFGYILFWIYPFLDISFFGYITSGYIRDISRIQNFSKRYKKIYLFRIYPKNIYLMRIYPMYPDISS